MRIIAGKLKGQRFEPPRSFRARPTTDSARESLFNILNNLVNFENLKVLDLFAGTGAFSLECFSRGAEHIMAVDVAPVSARFIPGIFRKLEMSNARFLRADVFEFMERSSEQFDLVLADPPFEAKFISKIPLTVFERKILNPGGILVLEHPPKMDFSAEKGFFNHRQYGHVNFSFFRNETQNAKPER